MSLLTVVLGDNSLKIAKRYVIDNSGLFDAHPELYDDSSYHLQSEISVEDLKLFLTFLRTTEPPPITPENAKSFCLLAQEFFAPTLYAVCAEFLDPGAAASTMHSVIVELQDAISEQTSICEAIGRDLPSSLSEFLISRLSPLSSEIQELRLAMQELKLEFESRLSSQIGELESRLKESIRSVRSRISLEKVALPITDSKSLNGIISYLTEKHGSLDEKGIVATTAKSVVDDYRIPRNVLALGRHSRFLSRDEPDQWLVWDFGRLCVFPTDYAIESMCLKSWIVEGSLDGESWTEMDRQTRNQDFRGAWNRQAFRMANPLESRFIRLTQTEAGWENKHELSLSCCEFFGILFE
jgi:hypothetical protein